MSKIKLWLLLAITSLFVGSSIAQSNFYKIYDVSGRQLMDGKYDDALATTLKALETAEKLKSPEYIAYANMQVGTVYYFLKDRRAAIKWYMKALSIMESEPADSLTGELCHNISVMYNELHIVDSCLKYSKKAIEILKLKGDYAELSLALAALTDVYMNQLKDYKIGEQLIIEAEKYAELSKDSEKISFAAIKRAQFMARRNDFKGAIEHLKIAEAVDKTVLPEELIYLYRMKSVWYIKAGDEVGLKYMDSLLMLKDSLYKKEGADKIAAYQIKFDTEKKERENKLLLQENNLKQTEIESRNKTIIGLLIGILLIAAIVAWRITVLNLRKKDAELKSVKNLQQEKERISRDLHDNVGGQLSYVLFSLDGIETKSKDELPQLAGNINQAVRNVIGNLRETIWAINDQNLTVTSFSDKLKVYAKSLFKDSITKVAIKETIVSDKELNSLVGLNLYRICQEILNNAFKYAKANELIVSISSDQSVTVIIEDDGVGFDIHNTESGYGLQNIQNRAKETGIELKFESEIGKGTRYVLIV